MADENPHQFSTQTTGVTFAQITDNTDFPHTGLIKALSLMAKGNMAVKGSATDFDITQATSGNVIVVKSGKIYRNGALHTIPSGGADTNFTSSAFNTTADVGSLYHLLVADSSNTLQIRKLSDATTADKVPEYTEGDTIIAVIMFNSSTAALGSMQIQFLTTGKDENNLSIGYNASGYTEAMSIEGSGTRTLFKNKVADADIRFVLADNTADERFEIYSDDDSDGDEGDTALFTVNGLGATSIAGTVNLGSVANAGTDTDKFLVLDSGGNVDFRTGTEVRSDIGAGTLSAESDTLDTVTGRGATTANDIVVGNATVNTITSSVNQNISYEVVDASNPTISGGKTVVYVHDISSLSNTLQLPPPASGNILYIQNFFTNTITIVGNPLINENNTTHPKITAPNTITLEPFEHVTLQSVTDSVPPLVTGHYIISDGDKDRSANYATAAQGVKADSALQTNSLVRYGLTSDLTLTSGSRETFTRNLFTGYAEDSNVVTWTGSSADITLKGAGIFEVNLYGYFAADTANSNLEFDLSIGDGTQSNRYAYYRNIINLNSVVRMSQFTTATIKTTADTVINLSGYIVWTGGNRKLVKTGSNDPYSTATPQYTGFTIRKVA